MLARLLLAGAAFAATLLASCSGMADVPSGTYAASAATGDARMIFDDEFSGSKLDRKSWFWCYPFGSPKYCTNGQKGVRYREREQYRPSQLVVRGGNLSLVAVRHSVVQHFPWTSGMVTTGGPFENTEPKPSFAFRYGYAEIRAQLPSGRGFWPAFWLLPASGAWPPEIDVMEWQGAQPHRDYMTVHFSDSRSKNDSLQRTYQGPNLSRAFHSYGIDWEPDALTWYVDGIQRFRVTASHIERRGGNYMRSPMYLLLNLAVGGWVSPPNRHTPSPSAMKIDYVRVWSKRP